MDQILKAALRPVVDDYAKRAKNHDLPLPVPERQRSLCLDLITERSANLEYLRTRQRELQPPTRQTGPQNPERAAPPKRPAAVLA